MILKGTTNESAPSSPERNAEILKGFKEDLGRTGISAFANEETVTGYPANIDAAGDYIVTVEETAVPSKKLNPGDIGFTPALDADTSKSYHIPGSDMPGSAGERSE